MGRSEESLNYFEENKGLSDEIEKTVVSLKEDYKEDSGLPYGDPRIHKIERFIQWLKDNGAKFSKIRIRHYGKEDREVHACEYIKGKEIILSIPKKLIITPDLGRNTQTGKLIQATDLKLNKEDIFYITVFILEQLHNTKSFWEPYIAAYPQSVTTLPMFYTEEEKLLLRGSPILEASADELKNIREEYSGVVKVVSPFKEFSLEEYGRVKMLVISRTMDMKIGGKEFKAIVPLADMFNHHYEKLGQTSWGFDPSSESFVLNAERDISLGDSVCVVVKRQICIDHGLKTNYKFLLHYGFVIKNNKKNAVYVKLFMNDKDPLCEYKEKMLGVEHKKVIKTFKYFEDFAENEAANEDFLGHLRFIVYEGDLNNVKAFFNPAIEDPQTCLPIKRKLEMPAINLENEKKMLIKLQSIAEDRLKNYPQDYEKDVDLMKHSKKFTFNHRNSIILRMGEKKVIIINDLQIFMQIIRMAKTILGIIDKPIEEAKTLAQSMLDNSEFSAYIKKNIISLLN